MSVKPPVYLETSVVSYLTAWRARDIVVAAHQQVTREWWDTAADRFEIVASDLVILEASHGDPVAAKERLDVLDPLPLLVDSPESEASRIGCLMMGSSREKRLRMQRTLLSPRQTRSAIW